MTNLKDESTAQQSKKKTKISDAAAAAAADTKSAEVDMIAGWLSGAAGILASNPLEVVKIRLQTQRGPTSQSQSQSQSRSPSPSPSHLQSSSSSPSASSSTSLASNTTKTSTPLQSASTSTSTSTPSRSIPSSFAGVPTSLPASSRQTTGSGSGTSSAAASSAVKESVKLARPVPSPSDGNVLSQLWRQGGVRFLFAGAAGPIVGLAFIDSIYFVTYGRCMTAFKQDRQDPSSLPFVFVSGAIAGAACALLQTPIEVVKCRAQAEYHPNAHKVLGSWGITKKMIRTEGLSGFYVGGLPTTVRDSISSGLFFSSYFWIRHALRGSSSSNNKEESFNATSKAEMARILAAGGIAGVLSAVVPYPIDIIKTRVQTANVTARAGGSGTAQHRVTMAQAARQIYADAASTGNMFGLSGFARGLAPTIAASFVGSAVTIGVFEGIVEMLNRRLDLKKNDL